MTVHPVHRHGVPLRTGPPTSRRARWAFGLAAGAAVVIASAAALFGLAYAVGGSDAVEDNWVGALVALALYAGLLASLTAFVLAVAAKVGHEPWARLWLPLSVLPALLAFLVLGEALWWE